MGIMPCVAASRSLKLGQCGMDVGVGKNTCHLVAALKLSGWTSFFLDIGVWGEWHSRCLKEFLSVIPILDVVPFNVRIHDSAV